MRELGRIAAQTAKQVMIQRIREAERGSLYEEYLERRGQIVTGRVARWEGGSLIVDLGRIEAILPKSEQIPGEAHLPDERIRAMILDVREQPSQVKIVLSRTHPDFISSLFELEVPEVAEKIIEIKALAREAGLPHQGGRQQPGPQGRRRRGLRGRPRQPHQEHRGRAGRREDRHRPLERVRPRSSSPTPSSPPRWPRSPCASSWGGRPWWSTEDQLSLAIGKRGQNVRLAARLTGWDIDILTPNEFNAGLDVLEKALRRVEGVDSTIVDQIMAMGMVNVLDVEEVGPEPLVNELELDRTMAQKIVISCAEEAKRVAEQQAAAAAEKKTAEK